MSLVYNQLPEDIWKMNLPLAAKVIAERICALTKNGEKECYLSNDYLVKLLGISNKTIQNSLALLKERNIITSNVTLIKNKKIRLINFIYHDFDSVKNTLSESEKNSSQKCKKYTFDSVKNTLSSSSSNEYRERIESEHTLCSIISLSGLIKLFKDTAKVMSNEHPLAQTLNLKHVAEKFYTVKASATFETDKALNSAVTKWLLDEIEHEMNSGKKSSASNQVDAFTAMERFSQFINSRNEKSITTGTDYALKSITKKE